MKVAFVFQNTRAALVAQVGRGEEPDSVLLGANHFADTGIDATVHDPALTRKPHGHFLDRVAWNLRELTVPWEVGDADVLFTPLGGLLPLAARLRRRLATVVINFGGFNVIYSRSGSARRRLLSRSLAAADEVVACSRSQRAGMVEEIGVPAERVRLLLLPVDERWWSPRPPAAPIEPYVLAVGKDLARDYGTLAEAVTGLDTRVELAVYPRNLEGIRLPPNVRARRVSSAELRDLYAGAACVVIPNRPDGYPYGSEGGGVTALLEAMAMARAVVATDRAFLRDYASEGQEALFVPPEDPPALRQGIERILGDAELAGRLGAAGRRRVERAHTTRGYAQALAPALLEAARGRGPRR